MCITQKKKSCSNLSLPVAKTIGAIKHQLKVQDASFEASAHVTRLQWSASETLPEQILKKKKKTLPELADNVFRKKKVVLLCCN